MVLQKKAPMITRLSPPWILEKSERVEWMEKNLENKVDIFNSVMNQW